MINFLTQQPPIYNYLTIIFCFLIVNITIKAISDNRTKKKIEQIEFNKISLILNSSISEDDYNILNTFVLRELNEYIIKNVAYKDITYINSNMEETMLRELTEQVCIKISPLLITRISLIYDVSGEKIIKLITDACHLCLTDYIIKYNTQGTNE